ncbi:alpha/beta hydrolase [Legionella waltersii]|uniref:Substrate of the Dot/Icm system n=1 Tax=Legionella waltersii TaxID=66969 RepID=A0A0W1AB39_9GAMM|nr:alpha/beta hydrolase [Legionella waltersii]KTD78368.1 substrate of the Dot/Icm system [Legionella waltersii]SNV06420.1 SidB [Legionella waltersii]
MAKYYKAPKPTYSNWEWFKFIAARTVFPPILLWDLLKMGANKWLGGYVGRIVLPAQTLGFTGVSESDLGRYNTSNYTCEKYDVETHDGVHLDTVQITHRSQKDRDPKFQQYIINFVGNGACYKDIMDEMQRDANELKVNVIGFDLRGVGSSTGHAQSKDDLVTDGIAQVQRLLDAGVSPENITLKAHSLGAGVASLVAHHFLQQDIRINVFSSRSFSSITNFVVGVIRRDYNEESPRGSLLARGNKEPIGKQILGWMLKPIIKLAVSLVNWEISAGDAFKEIPEEFRDYMVVRSKKDIRADRLDDQVIPHYASVHEALSSERKDKKAAIDKLIKAAEKSHDVEKVSRLKAERNRIKESHKMDTISTDRYAEGHNSPWNGLKNRLGTNGHEFFKAFFQRADKDHGVHETQQSIKYL